MAFAGAVNNIYSRHDGRLHCLAIFTSPAYRRLYCEKSARMVARFLALAELAFARRLGHQKSCSGVMLVERRTGIERERIAGRATLQDMA